MSGRASIAAAAAAAVVLVAAYAVLGGGRYEPPATADPCDLRAARTPATTDALAERLTLSALDGVACALDLSREEIVLAAFSDSERDRLARTHGVDRGRLAGAVQAGLRRAVGEAERAGVIDAPNAALLLAALLALDGVIGGLDDG